ncbi:DUF6585 family protein [Roseivirga sp. BDSF3-8]|uniref:DUF6585 family protein n=1 Tax=Roseivirga sp. BDSF3-8 TaxID=3241598 RepID=UPI00353233AA
MFTLGLGILLLWKESMNDEKAASGEMVQFLPGIGMLVFGLLVAVYYLKTLRKIKLTDSGIHLSGILSSSFIAWNEIQETYLSGKQGESFLWITMPFEAITVVLKNDEPVILLKNYYRNNEELCQAINHINQQKKQQVRPNLTGFKPSRLSLPGYVNPAGLTSYKGNHFFTFNWLFVYACLTASFFILFLDIPIVSKLIMTGMVLLLCVLLSIQLYYFEADKDFLIVKNHIWPFHQRAFRLSDITELVIESPHQRSHTLRIITSDFKNRVYGAGSLRNKTWRQFIVDMEKQGIRVRNEAIFF